MPTFTLCTIVGPVAPAALRAHVDALIAQGCQDWELVLVDATEAGDVNERIGGRRLADQRITVVRCPAGTSVAATANAAVDARTGPLFALVEPDGLLEPDALEQVARAMADPTIEVAFTDEDRLSEHDGLVDPFFKPDWSPERMRAQDCCGLLTVLRRPLFERVGGLRPGFGGARGYDLLLRATEGGTVVHHLPLVLYHACPDPVGPSHPPAAPDTARLRAVADHMVRRDVPAAVEPIPGTAWHRVRRTLPVHPPSVSVVIPTAGADRPVWGVDRPLVLDAVASLRSCTTYPDVEVALVVDPATPGEVIAALAELDVTLVPSTAPFNFSRRCNEGIAATSGELVVLLNDDVRVEQDDWLEVMVAHLLEPDVGVVGARLRYADGRLQHGGVLLNAQALHTFSGFADDEPGPHGLLQVDREVTAVTGACLATRRALLSDLGGLDERFAVAFNDLDWCLRVRAAGHRVIWTPHATLYHFESQSRPGDAAQADIDLLYERWGPELHHDPYGNANLAPKQAAWIPSWRVRRRHLTRSAAVARVVRRSTR